MDKITITVANMFHLLPADAQFHVLHKLLREPGVQAALLNVMQSVRDPESECIEAMEVIDE